MFRPVRRPPGLKTDLQLPGQRVVVNGGTQPIQNLFHWTDPNAPANQHHQPDRFTGGNAGKKNTGKKATPDDDGEVGQRKPGYLDPKLQDKIFQQQGTGVFRRARELIVRIGRPRQP